MAQTFDFTGIAPAPPEPPRPPAMTFATVNGQQVPIGDDDTDAPPRAAAPAAPAYNFAGIPPAAEPSLWQKANTSPIHAQLEAARQAVTEYLTRPDLGEQRANDRIPGLGTASAMVRGATAGMAEGALNYAEAAYTTPVGFALWLTGLGPTSKAIQAVPALKPLLALPAVQALRKTVHGVAGAAFAAHGLGTMADAATSDAPIGQRLEQGAQGLFETAGGLVGVHEATAGPRAAWAQQRRTAAGAAAVLAFKQAAPPSASAPYTDAEFQRAKPYLDAEHITTQPITSIPEAVTAADNQIKGLADGVRAEIAKNPGERIQTRPLDAVTAALANVPRSDALAKGLAKLETLGLDQPLTVERADAIREQLNAENAAVLANNKYDIAIARKVDPAFAAREAAAASLRTGIYDVLDARAGVGGFARNVRADEGALIAVRGALMRQLYAGENTVGGTGTTSAPRRALARAVEVGATGAGGFVGGYLAGGEGVGGATAGATAGAIAGKEAGRVLGAYIDRPPITRDALIEKAFKGAGTGLAVPPGAPGPRAGPGAPGGGPGGPGAGPGGPPAGPGLPPPAAPPSPAAARQIGVGTFLALRARGYSRTQAVQMAASYVRSLGAGPEAPPFTEGELVPPGGLPPGPAGPRGFLPPRPPPRLGPGPGFVVGADGAAVPLADAGPLIPDNGARVPTMPPGGYQRPPGRDRSFVRAVPGTYAERVAAAAATPEAAAGTPIALDEAARGGTIPPADAAPVPASPVGPQPLAPAGAGRVAPDRGAELSAPARERVLTPAERTARARERAASRDAERAAAAAEEHDGLTALVAKAQANGYPGDPATLYGELADRLQGIKELHAELDAGDSNGLSLLRAIADAGGISIHNESAQKGEIAWMKEFRDQAPGRRKVGTDQDGKPIYAYNTGDQHGGAKLNTLDSVRGVRGVFRDNRARGSLKIAEGSLDHILETITQEGRFPQIRSINDLVDAYREAATGREDTRNALADLGATSHDLIGTATIHPEDDLSFDPAALEAESQAHAAAGGGAAPAPAPAPGAPVADVGDVADTAPDPLITLIGDHHAASEALRTASAEWKAGTITDAAFLKARRAFETAQAALDTAQGTSYQAPDLNRPIDPKQRLEKKAAADAASLAAERAQAETRGQFIQGKTRYTVLADGRVQRDDAVGTRGRRWAMGTAVDPSEPGVYLPVPVRQYLAEKATRDAAPPVSDVADTAPTAAAPAAAAPAAPRTAAQLLEAAAPELGLTLSTDVEDMRGRLYQRAADILKRQPTRAELAAVAEDWIQWTRSLRAADRPGTHDELQSRIRSVLTTVGPRPAPTAREGSRPDAPAAAAPVADVSDVLDTGERQGRIPGAGAARQVGKANVSFRAPAQASGDDFTLSTPLTDEQRAADARAAAGPSLFGEPAAPAPGEAPREISYGFTTYRQRPDGSVDRFTIKKGGGEVFKSNTPADLVTSGNFLPKAVQEWPRPGDAPPAAAARADVPHVADARQRLAAAGGPAYGELVTFRLPDASEKGSHKQAGTVIDVRPDGRLDIRLQQGGIVQQAPDAIARPNAPAAASSAPAAERPAIVDRVTDDRGQAWQRNDRVANGLGWQGKIASFPTDRIAVVHFETPTFHIDRVPISELKLERPRTADEAPLDGGPMPAAPVSDVADTPALKRGDRVRYDWNGETRIGTITDPGEPGRMRARILTEKGSYTDAWPSDLTLADASSSAPVGDVGDVADTRPRSTGGPYLPDPTRSATERGGAVVLASSPAPKASSAAPGVSENDIPLELATRAHANTSHVPEDRGAAERARYVDHMEAVWADLSGRAQTPEQQAIAAAEFARYRAGYLERTRAQLSQRSGLASSMITGPANFPAARMAKKNAAYDKGVTAFVEWDQRARRAMREAVDPSAAVSISADRPDAPDALQAKIEDARKLHDQMKAINTIVRQKTNDTQKIAAMQAIGVTEDAARRALQPDFAGRLGFPGYALRNNAARIDAMQERIRTIATERARPLGSATFDGGTIAENADANRVQVTFDAKPDEAMRSKLKANGFKWSPSQQVWQRQRTQHARDAIQRIFGVTLTPPSE